MWILRDVDHTTDYVCFGVPALVENVSNLDYAHGQINVVLDVGTHVQLIESVAGAETVLLDGWLTSSSGASTGGQCSFQMYEYAQELSKMRAGSAANAFTITVAASANVDTTIATVLTGTGWTLGTTGTGYMVAGMQFVGVNVLDILKKIFGDLLKDAGGSSISRYFWFDSTTKTVYFGTARTTWNPATLQIVTGKDVRRVNAQDSNLRMYDAVMVMGATNSVFAMYPPTCTTQKVAVITDTSLSTVEACAALAYTKYTNMYGTKIDRPQLKMPPFKAMSGSTRIRAGDLVTVDAVQMMCVDAVWKLDAVTLGFNSRLPIDTEDDQALSAGSSAAAVDAVWDGGQNNVGPSASGKWTLNISDVTKVREFVLKMKLNKLTRMSSDQAAYSGISGTGSANTGLTVTGSRAAGINYAGNMNNNTSITSESIAYNSTVSVSSATTWSDVTDRVAFTYNLSNRHFGIILVSLTVTPDASSNCIWYVGFANYNGTVMSTQKVAFPSNDSPYATATATVAHMLVSYDSQSTADYGYYIYVKKYNSSQPTISLKSFSVSVMQANKHDHPVTDATHTNPITDTSHTNPITDVSQTHAANNTPIEVTTYPTTVVVKVNGTTVKSDAGGAEALLDCGDITANLVTGANTIEVTSAAAGNVQAMGNYISYGA